MQTDAGGVRIEYVALEELERWPRNPKMHDEAHIERSIERFGFVNPILIDERTGRIVAGHGRLDALQAMRERGDAPPERVKEEGGRWLVPVVRGVSFNSDVEAQAHLVADNRAVELGGWDDSALVEMLQDVAAQSEELLEAAGYAQRDLERMLTAAHQAMIEEPEVSGEHLDAIRDEWQTETGQLWIIPSAHGGDHRLICGDSTDQTVVANLFRGDYWRELVTDPPYGIDYAKKNEFLNAVGKSMRLEVPIDGDERRGTTAADLWRAAFGLAVIFGEPGATYYITTPTGDMLPSMLQAVADAGMPMRHGLVWVKNNIVLGRSDYNYKHEFIIYGWLPGAPHTFNGMGGEASVWEFDKPHSSKLHPTMKPVALFEYAITHGSNTGEVVFDPFSGSGTTILACENTARLARCVEIDPRYVAVALLRASELGLEPHLVEGG